MLRLERVVFGWGERDYVFDMVARPGEITVVTGASGAGKSTLLDLIAGFLSPRSGAIRLDDAEITGLMPEARPVSILFQSETLFEHLSAQSNVALGLRRADRAAVAAALGEVGLALLGRQRAQTLSGGEKQRVALARTLLRNRPVLLLDEPFSALDDATRSEMRDLVRRLTRTHAWTTVLVTHHADDIAALADRAYHLADGRLRAAISNAQ